MALAVLGTVLDRFQRAWGSIADDRKERGLDEQSTERQARLYVDPETGVSATGVSDAGVTEYWEEHNPPAV